MKNDIGKHVSTRTILCLFVIYSALSAKDNTKYYTLTKYTAEKTHPATMPSRMAGTLTPKLTNQNSPLSLTIGAIGASLLPMGSQGRKQSPCRSAGKTTTTTTTTRQDSGWEISLHCESSHVTCGNHPSVIENTCKLKLHGIILKSPLGKSSCLYSLETHCECYKSSFFYKLKPSDIFIFGILLAFLFLFWPCFNIQGVQKLTLPF